MAALDRGRECMETVKESWSTAVGNNYFAVHLPGIPILPTCWETYRENRNKMQTRARHGGLGSNYMLQTDLKAICLVTCLSFKTKEPKQLFPSSPTASDRSRSQASPVSSSLQQLGGWIHSPLDQGVGPAPSAKPTVVTGK